MEYEIAEILDSRGKIVVVPSQRITRAESATRLDVREVLAVHPGCALCRSGTEYRHAFRLERLPGGICTHCSAPPFRGTPNANIGKDSQRAVRAVTDVLIARRPSAPRQTSRRLACCYKTTRL